MLTRQLDLGKSDAVIDDRGEIIATAPDKDHMNKKTQGFNDEQKVFLAEMLAKLNLQLAFGSQKNQPDKSGTETFWGTDIEDLSKEERAKYKTHVLDIWDDIVRHNHADQIAEGINDFMFRHFGVFNVEPASQGYMCRMRIPSCKLRGDQLMRLGDLAENIAGGYAHVTTRGNLQFREIKANHVLDLFAELYDTGLSCKGSGADSARNITASPTAGFDPLEIIDLHQYGIEVSHRILNNRDLHGLPRKFNIAFDNAGSISCVSDTNDVAFVAVEVLENEQNIAPGIYCRLALGGITGHKNFARDTGYICKPETSPEISEAILRVFCEHGDRTNRNKARFKYVLDQHGFQWVIEKIQEKLDSFGNGTELIACEQRFEAPRAAINRQGHIGIHPQSQPGLSYIGVALKVGRLSPSQMRGLGHIAQRYGSNDIRLTVWQNLIIPGILNEKTAEASQAIEALGLSVSVNSFSAGAIACTGKWACKLANAYTKQDTEAVIDHLQNRFQLDQPINIHFTGCPNSCAQHYIGDIGCIGTTATDGSTGYNIFVGGGCDHDQGLARFLCGPIASSYICQTFELIIGNYLSQRHGQEPFLSFVRRQEDEQLQNVLLAQ